MKKNIMIFLSSFWDWFKYGLISFKRYVLPKSLLSRFILIILIPLLLLQVLVLIVFFNRHWETIERRLARDVVGEIRMIIDRIQDPTITNEELDILYYQFDNRLNISISLDKGNTLLPKAKLKNSYHTSELLKLFNEAGYPFLIEEIDSDTIKVRLQLDQGILNVLIPKKRFFSSTVYVFSLLMFFFSILLFWITFLFMKNQIRPIERLSKAAELFGQTQSVANFKPEGATEVRQAGQSFIQMGNRIQRYLTERTGMLSGVSHDLRTPLTRMKLQLSMLEPNEAISELQDDVQEMQDMLEAYLSFARGEGKENFETVNLNELIADLVAKFTKTGQQIDYHQECQIDCFCRPNDLTRAIMNLLSNAGRYAKKTRITLGNYRKMIRVIVDDNGPGIPPEKHNEVFKAFYRLEKSRNTKTGGIGLGLTIARDIVLSHGGKIELSDSPMGGLRATILLPILKSDKI